ncbi:MAG: uroporphyrinogen-III C-methyltransferase [Phototrophicales bacterium]|jgi:uroporphyrin-III C-methyltransferase|nr:MAG: uroporphyrinogen-III C-methyltransferase [Phototrophicales bacterium]
MTSTIGKVYLVGAGPGDPDLITVKGLRLLQHADVVIYDRLAPKALLTHVPNGAELIDASKDGHQHTLKQPEINALLVQKAKEGKQVVRLKGGDPFVFGRGAEEALYCHAAGVPFEIVPGVTSAIAVPAYAGVSVTHRDYASAFTVFTGHENPNKPANILDFEAIAHAAKAGTLVMLMGATYLQDLIRHLITSGIDPQTPAMCIEWGTVPQQRVVTAPLVDLPERAKADNIGSPAITVIGEVVHLREQGLRWFD